MQLILVQAIYYFADVLKFLILIRIIMSWINISRDNFFIQLLYMVTEPILGPIRRLLNKSPLGGAGMMLDFSPIIAVLLISLVSSSLISVIVSL